MVLLIAFLVIEIYILFFAEALPLGGHVALSISSVPLSKRCLVLLVWVMSAIFGLVFENHSSARIVVWGGQLCGILMLLSFSNDT